MTTSTLTTWLTDTLHTSSWFGQVSSTLERLASGTKSQPEALLEGLTNPSIKAMLLLGLLGKLKRSIVVVCPDPQQLTRLQVAMEGLVGHTTTQDLLHRYPADIFSPYDGAVLPSVFLREHYRFLQACQRNDRPKIYLVAARSLVIQFPSLGDREAHGLTIEEEQEIAPETLVEHCLAMGYTQTGLVLEAGDISRRGDIVDVFPIQGEPVRFSFFGDTVESLRQMDAESQRSIQPLEKATLLPRSTLVLNAKAKATLEGELPRQLQAISKRFQGGQEVEGLAATINNQLQALEQDFLPDGLDYYAPLLHEDWQSLAQVFPKDCLLITESWAEVVSQVEGLADRLTNQRQKELDTARLLDVGTHWHATADKALSRLKQQPAITLQIEPFGAAAKDAQADATRHLPPFASEGIPRFQADLLKAVEQFATWRRNGSQVIVATDYPQRVLDTCKEYDVTAEYWPDNAAPPASLRWTEKNRPEGLPVLITKNALADGFWWTDENLLLLTDAELFGRQRARRVVAEVKGKKKDDPEVIQSLNQLRPGDYVVHVKHGIGQFMELARLRMDGQMREYLTIQYKGNDRVYVPVEQLNLLTRYRGSGDAKPPLSKMGGAEWKKVQKKVKTSLASIAKELVALYSARQKVEGHAFEPDTPWQVEMEEAFPFQETPDQWKAICDAKNDMESTKPMDRLICGDVGFGKTEVALRAVFKAVVSGKQAAILVPTTILAQQHFNTFVERLKPYPMRVGLLSRFRSPKEQREIIERLRSGDVDVVVGTHRLLQKDVRFKDLGLLVIDEEHRFGVAHKEKIKHMRTHVDVLTMSATPIPRTLYMSLSGVREMSLINTPPVNRLPVQTFVGPKNPAQMRMAILHEMDRGGQVYYLHNRVETIYGVADQLKDLVPEAKIAVAHGQLNPRDLESIMLEFSSGGYDVLVCTTIVESGVDIPTANTLIIDDSDRYGLAQLYQIRGRVGRSETQAYAYLYYEPEKMLTEDTKKRLRAIREFTALGSGYQIAMRDLEIRGVGNILGAEQHGHMIKVGFEMYCDMLDQAIDAAQQGTEVPDELPEPSVIDINVTALIPDKYVGDKDVKLNEYKRLANTTSEKALDIIEAEWHDRFGPIPDHTQTLLQLTRLRIQATDLGVPMVRTEDDMLRITVPYSLQEWMEIQKRLPTKLGNKLRWIAGVRTNASSLPTLVHRLSGMDGYSQMKLVAELFQHLKKLTKALSEEATAAR